MSDSVQHWTWAVPIIASFVALTGALLGLYIQVRNFQKQIRSSHTLKIAEMRRSWIDNLREAMSKYQSYGVTPGLDHGTMREYYEWGTRVELLMDPGDPDYNELHNCLYKFLSAETLKEKYAANPNYVAVCQRILKREWDRLEKEVRTLQN